MNERKFELHCRELLEEYGMNRADEYHREVILKYNLFERLCWKFHLWNYHRRIRNVQHIRLT